MGADSSKQATTPIINANTQGAAEDDKEEEEEVHDFDSFKDDSTLTTRSSTGLGSGAGHWSSSLSSDRRFLSQSSSAGHGGSTNASSGPSRHDYSYFDESHSVLLQSYATNSMVSTKDRHRGLKRAGKTTTTAGAAASLSKAHPAASSSYRTSRHSTSTTLRHERYKSTRHQSDRRRNKTTSFGALQGIAMESIDVGSLIGSMVVHQNPQQHNRREQKKKKRREKQHGQPEHYSSSSSSSTSTQRTARATSIRPSYHPSHQAIDSSLPSPWRQEHHLASDQLDLPHQRQHYHQSREAYGDVHPPKPPLLQPSDRRFAEERYYNPALHLQDSINAQQRDGPFPQYTHGPSHASGIPPSVLYELEQRRLEANQNVPTHGQETGDEVQWRRDLTHLDSNAKPPPYMSYGSVQQQLDGVVPDATSRMSRPGSKMKPFLSEPRVVRMLHGSEAQTQQPGPNRLHSAHSNVARTPNSRIPQQTPHNQRYSLERRRDSAYSHHQQQQLPTLALSRVPGGQTPLHQPTTTTSALSMLHNSGPKRRLALEGHDASPPRQEVERMRIVQEHPVEATVEKLPTRDIVARSSWNNHLVQKGLTLNDNNNNSQVGSPNLLGVTLDKHEPFFTFPDRTAHPPESKPSATIPISESKSPPPLPPRWRFSPQSPKLGASLQKPMSVVDQQDSNLSRLLLSSGRRENPAPRGAWALAGKAHVGAEEEEDVSISSIRGEAQPILDDHAMMFDMD